MEKDPVRKPGIKATEFWNIPVFVAVLVANGTPYVNIADTHISLLAALMFGYGVGTQFKKHQLAKNESKKEPTNA